MRTYCDRKGLLMKLRVSGSRFLLLPLTAAFLSAGTAPLSETFDDNLADGFTQAGTSGVYSLQAQSPSGYAYRATLASGTGHTTASSGLVIDNVAGTAFSVTTQLVITSLTAPGSGSINAGLGLFSSTADFSTGSQYRLLYQLSSGNAGQLLLLRNGTTIAQSTALMPPRLNITYTLRAYVSYASGTATIRGQLSDDANTIAVTATDNAPLPGLYFGYRTALNPSGGATSVTINYDNFAVAPTPTTPAGDPGTTTGSLSVGGTLDVNGNAITFGSSGGTYAAGLLYDDAAGGDLLFDLTASTATWSWQHGGLLGMTLDAQNRLSLFTASSGATPALQLDPVGTSEFGSVKIRDSLTVGGDLRIAPRGDLLMGDYTSGTAPSP
jgi:hypothetical protein